MELGNFIWGHSRGEHPVDRDLDDHWHSWMEKLGFDGYGYKEGHDEWGFENDTFRMQPYYWGDCECEQEEHIQDCPCSKPNFLFKPTGFELRWYKYALRDSYSSKPLTKELIDQMMAECERSLR